jgi:hypothetical protein
MTSITPTGRAVAGSGQPVETAVSDAEASIIEFDGSISGGGSVRRNRLLDSRKRRLAARN